MKNKEKSMSESFESMYFAVYKDDHHDKHYKIFSNSNPYTLKVKDENSQSIDIDINTLSTLLYDAIDHYINKGK